MQLAIAKTCISPLFSNSLSHGALWASDDDKARRMKWRKYTVAEWLDYLRDVNAISNGMASCHLSLADLSYANEPGETGNQKNLLFFSLALVHSAIRKLV